MSFVRLTNIHKENNKILFVFCYSHDLQKYFTDQSFIVEYSEDISAVPDAVCAIPFVCSVLPIIWLTDSTLELAELDQDFYDSIPEFKKGYIQMFPDVDFLGRLSVNKVIDCNRSELHGAVVFFSGGLDATTTLFRHMMEKPDLLSIWGADIAFDNEKGWNVLKTALSEAAQFYKLKHIVVHSSFRCFDREDNLGNAFSKYLHDSWWHGVKHGIGLIGHAAPYMWLTRKKTVYLASSFCPDDGKIICASDPSIDNFVRFCGCNICHDGFELSRQAKTQLVVDYQKKHEISQIPLHVCWESNDGRNCCKCEKCFRTIVSIFLAGGDPHMYGFSISPATWYALYELLALKYEYAEHIMRYWQGLQKEFLRKWPLLKDTIYARRLRWLLTFDFEHPDKNFNRRIYNARKRFVNGAKRLIHTFPFAEKCVRLLFHPQYIMNFFRFAFYIFFPLGKKIWIMGSPLHGNLGDSAIILAELKLMREIGVSPRSVKEVSIDEYNRYKKWVRRAVSSKDLITSPGGGNMGDIWFSEEAFRRMILQDFPDNCFILFPHTIYYSSTQIGREEEQRARFFYDNPQNLLLARDAVSYRKFLDLFPHANCFLFPDVVLSFRTEDFFAGSNERSGVLVCIRKDQESNLPEAEYSQLLSFVRKKCKIVNFTDTHIEKNIIRKDRLEHVKKKISEFARAELVITDRLHGMIFSVVTATPCLVLGNNNHKVAECYKWVQYLPFVKFAQSIDEAERFLPELLEMRNCTFDNTPLVPYFDKLKSLFAEKLQ